MAFFNFGRARKLKFQKNIIFESHFLKRLSPIESYEFIQLCHRRSYKAGEYIYHQGDPATGMYILEEGKVELIVESSTTEENPDAPVMIIEAPESFGAFSVGYNVRRMSSAKCIQDVTVYGFFNSDFETLRNRHPRIAIKFLEILNIITTRQLEITLQKLKDVTDEQQASALLFDTYDMARLQSEED